MGKRPVVVGVLFFAILAAGAPMPAHAANTVDVVYLKNGSIIRGSVIEEVPGKTIKIQTADGSVFVYPMAQVVKITKEQAKQPSGGGTSTQAAAASTPVPGFDLLFNPLGFLQFGPMVDLEFKTSPNLFFVVDFRFAGLGLLSHIIEYYDLSIASFAAGVGIRYFFRTPGISGAPYLGVISEVGYNSFPGEGEDMYVVLALNAGYRWQWGSTAMNVGGFLGAAPTVLNDLPNAYYPVTPVAMLELSWAFGL